MLWISRQLGGMLASQWTTARFKKVRTGERHQRSRRQTSLQKYSRFGAYSIKFRAVLTDKLGLPDSMSGHVRHCACRRTVSGWSRKESVDGSLEESSAS
jgi:hypothetical protein